jgi:REP element-mobilizing transposase RayT
MASGIQLKSRIAANQTFQVTSHGIGALAPFNRSIDKREFLSRFMWYLSPEPWSDASRRPYEKLYDQVAVLAYCVLDNHFHLVVHQFTPDGMRRLMTRVLTSYGMYYNAAQSPRRRGPIFDGRYAADPMRDPDHIKEMIGYTVLNDPIRQHGNQFSSSAIHLGDVNSSWLANDLTLGVFGGRDGFREYMNRTGPKRVASKLERWGVDPKLHPYRPI